MISVAAFFWMVPTLFVLFGVAFACVGWHPSGTKSARWASAGFLSAAAGSILDTQRTHLPPICDSFATPAHWLAIYALLQSMLIRHGKHIPHIPVIIWGVVSLSVHIYLVAMKHPIPDRIMVMNITVPLLMAIAVPSLWQSRKMVIDKVLAGLVIAAILTYPVRIAMFVSQHQARELIGPWTWSQYIIIFYLVIATLGIFTALAIMLATGMDIIGKSNEASEIDPLTGIGNRRAVDRWIENDSRNRCYGALIMIDLDKFKLVNDSFGHDAGDKVLVQTTQELSAKLGSFAHVARLGGEEFVALVFDNESANAGMLAMTIREAIAKIEFDAPLNSLKLTASVGVAERQKDQSLRALMQNADMAVYQAKAGGRNATIRADYRDGLCVMKAVA